MTVITIPQILVQQLSEEGAKALSELLNQFQPESKNDLIQIAEERFERRIAQMESRLIKWMFLFWIGQSITGVGLAITIINTLQ